MTPARSAQRSVLALGVRNYRIYLAGQGLANLGVWMQGIALDWLVLTLTHDATAVGITMALQFAPMLALGMHGGMLADRLPKRAVIITTQTLNGVLTGVLAALTFTGAITAYAVYAFAFMTGLVMVVDGPTRQAFVSEMVPPKYLRNAISLNAVVLQVTRLVAPAIAGTVIGAAGTGWVFALSASCCAGPVVALSSLRTTELHPSPRAAGQVQSVRAAVQHVASQPQIASTIVLVAVVGTFGLNFPVVLTAMAAREFHGDASTYGAFNVALAVGSLVGAMLAGVRDDHRLRAIILAAGLFGVVQFVTAGAPDRALFMVGLAAVGGTNLVFQTAANTSVQLWVDGAMRGRVLGLYMLALLGSTPLGAPVVGVITEHAGARVGMAVCGLAPALAAVAVGMHRSAARKHGLVSNSSIL